MTQVFISFWQIADIALPKVCVKFFPSTKFYIHVIFFFKNNLQEAAKVENINICFKNELEIHFPRKQTLWN